MDGDVIAVKRCPQCGETKEHGEFYRNRAQRDGLSPYCRPCTRLANRRWQDANPEKTREYGQRYRQTHLAEVRNRGREAARDGRQADPERFRGYEQRRCGASRARRRERAKQRYAADREAVFDHYGRSCACCGSGDRLTVDHVNGDGAQHRARIGEGGAQMYRWLVANGFPCGFQTLCNPCNISKKDGEHCRIDHDVTSTAP